MRWILPWLLALPLAAEPITFNKHIAPVVFQYCSPCHRAGEAAPFPLLTYEEVKNHAIQIVAVTERRFMPPWPPEPGFGDFVGERRLTVVQLELIAEWVKEGCPEGNPTDLPPKPQFTEGWQIGPPDLVIQIPKPYHLTAGGSDTFRNFAVSSNLKETRYVKALELRPGNKRVVHHANIWIDRRQWLRQREGEGGQPGFPGMDVSTEARSDSFDPDSHFLFWKPGSVLQPVSDDMSWRLDPGTDLIINMHLQPSGKEEVLQPVLGLYFASHPARLHPILVQLEHDGALDIPPGDQEFAVEDQLTLPVGVEVLAIYPHAHYLGKHVDAWATLPDGTRTWLIKINDWDINWQAVYTYRQPVWLPPGTTVAMRITYDNSASNPRNPNQPPKRVRTGPRSEDEMGHVWLQVLPKEESARDPRLTLQEAVMQHRLEKYPGDFAAHCNLGELLVTQGHYREAISHFQKALETQPGSATARSGLGASLLADGRIDEAVRELKQTLFIAPDHLNARMNLARALGAKGDWAGAEAELKTILKQRPDNSDALIGLASLYLGQKRYDEALPNFQEAARLRPQDADIWTNLGVVLAIRGDWAGAVKAFEEALKLNPKHDTARAYLARAQAALASKR